MFDESTNRFELSGWCSPRLCCDYRQITDELLNEADAAVRGSGEAGEERRRVAAVEMQFCSGRSSLARQGRYADTAVKTVEARRLLAARRWGGGFFAPG